MPISYLNLGNNQLTSLGTFSGLSNCSLDLSGNRLTTLPSGLFDGVSLRTLDLRDNRLVDISSLADLTYTAEIDLSHNAVSDISPLANVAGLQRLDLSHNEIVDITPLAGLADLSWLDLSHNAIADVSSLVKNRTLGRGDTAYLHANPLSHSSISEDMPMLRGNGVIVFHVLLWPTDASAREGADFEFAVRLSSAVHDPVAAQWQVINRDSDDAGRFSSLLPNGLTTARGDMPLASGELTIPGGSTRTTVPVPGAIEDAADEKHETFVFALWPNANGFPNGVTLEAPESYQAQWSAGVGLIVDAAGPSHHIPLFVGRARESRQGFLRVINRGDRTPVHVEVRDHAGARYGPTTLSIQDGAVAHFNSADLEDGNFDKGLSRGVGTGTGDWHVKLWANDIEALAYMRTSDGFLTSIHDVVPRLPDGTYRVPTFNPASNINQVSMLRLVSQGSEVATIAISGVDDKGASPGDTVSFSLDPGSVRTLSAQDLESGNGLDGALGDGRGKWRLIVASDEPISVASLLESPTRHLTNLSTVPDNKERVEGGATKHHVPLFLSAADQHQRKSFVRVINSGDEAAAVRITAYDDSDRDYESMTLTVGAGEATHFNSDDIELGNANRGLSGVGAGEGDWRLELRSDAAVDVLAYIRHPDGFLTSMHDLVPLSAEGYAVPFFNPASNRRQASLLRVVNAGGDDAEVAIRGIDDQGVTRGSVSFAVPAGRSRTFSASDLEVGGDALTGTLGNGEGKWRLIVTSDRPIQVMSLLESPAGNLTNLSTAPVAEAP